MSERNPFPGGKGLKAVFFDFDGTLALPTLDFAEMRKRALDAILPFAVEPFSPKRMVMEEIERVCAPLSPEIAAEARKAAYEAIENVELEAARRSSLFPFVRPALDVLARNNIAFGIITRNYPPAVYTVFPDLKELTPCVLTREDVENVKPHPEHLLKAFEVLGVAPENSLMVGDHQTDILVGKRAGCYTAGVATGVASLEQLAAADADYVAADAGELMNVLGLA